MKSSITQKTLGPKPLSIEKTMQDSM